MTITEWLKNKTMALAIAFSNVQDDVLGQDGKGMSEGGKQERRHNQGTLADALLRGELTQEVRDLRWRMYKVTKAAEDIKLKVDYIDEEGNVYYKSQTRDNRISNVKVDEFDDFQVELVYFNDKLTRTINESLSGFNDAELSAATSNDLYSMNQVKRSLDILRDFHPRFYLEKYVRKLCVRKITDTEKLLEFYVSKYVDEYDINSKLFINNVKKLIEFGPTGLNTFDFDEVAFISENTLGTADSLAYAYKIISFDKVIEFDGNYVIKYRAEVVINGEDILAKYIEDELELKYKNKEKRMSNKG